MVRIFWSAVAVLVIATAAVFFLPSGGSAPAGETRTVAQTRPERSEGVKPGVARPRDERSDTALSPVAEATPDPAGDAPRADADASVREGQSFGFAGEQPDAGPVEGETPDAQAAVPAEVRPAEVEIPASMPRPEEDAGDAGPGEPVVSAPAVERDEPDADADAEEAAAPAAVVEAPAPAPEPDVDSAEDAAEVVSDDAGDDEAEPEGQVGEEDGAGENATVADEGSETGEKTDREGAAPSETVADELDAAPTIAVTPRPAQPKADRPAGSVAEAPAEPVVETPTGLLLDGRWNVEGKGTKGEPYVIDWDMLVAVRREYQPRLGKTAIPEWIAALNDKTVTIRGYALLPMGMSSMSELLVMLNQWDSCCIGIPPTPYDAIEVRLEKDLSPQAQSMFSHSGQLSFGDITGTFKVDPYIVQGYLLGLYLMDDASATLLGPAGTP